MEPFVCINYNNNFINTNNGNQTDKNKDKNKNIIPIKKQRTTKTHSIRKTNGKNNNILPVHEDFDFNLEEDRLKQNYSLLSIEKIKYKPHEYICKNRYYFKKIVNDKSPFFYNFGSSLDFEFEFNFKLDIEFHFEFEVYFLKNINNLKLFIKENIKNERLILQVLTTAIDIKKSENRNLLKFIVNVYYFILQLLIAEKVTDINLKVNKKICKYFKMMVRDKDYVICKDLLKLDELLLLKTITYNIDHRIKFNFYSIFREISRTEFKRYSELIRNPDFFSFIERIKVILFGLFNTLRQIFSELIN